MRYSGGLQFLVASGVVGMVLCGQAPTRAEQSWSPRPLITAHLVVLFSAETTKHYTAFCSALYPELASGISEGYAVYLTQNTAVTTRARDQVVRIPSAVLHGHERVEVEERIANNLRDLPDDAERSMRKYLAGLPEAQRRAQCTTLRSELLRGVHDIAQRDPAAVNMLHAFAAWLQQQTN